MYFRWIFLPLLLIVGSVAQGQQVALEPGFQSLFNGEDLSGWYAIKTYNPREFAKKSPEERTQIIEKAKSKTSEFWRVEDGVIVNDGEGPYLTSDKSYRDFELLLEYKTVANADSGIYLKATPQIQIWDYTEAGGKWNIGADKGSGGLWNNPAGSNGKDPSVLADKPFGEWNSFRIRQIGARTWVWLNGKLVVDNAEMYDYWSKQKLPLIASGPIQLQTHGGEIRWRNIAIKEFSTDEANSILRENSPDGFASIFNGKDLSGWKGPVDNYEVIDGVIRCKQGKGGTIYHETELTDFVAQLEFKLPPGGNNGLAIRYPGNGDTAYVGMCELQVLDSEHPKFKNLDARQYHGSAYGMQAAHRGFHRQTGDWNFQEVTVKGSTIRVELNGTVILDTDLSLITEYMGDRPHPGKDRKSGYFGFAGHSDPVEYRNIRIKQLKAD